MIPQLTVRIVAMIVGALLIIAVLIFGLTECQKRRSQAAQARVERSQTEALSNSAADAIGAVAASGANQVASEGLTRSNEREIRNASGANDAVNPAVRDAGLRSLCRRAAYRDSERCRLLEAPAR